MTVKIDLKELAGGYAMLSDQTRLGILQALAGGPMNVLRLSKVLKRKQPIVSNHLGILRMNGLVVGTRKSKEVFYETDKAALKALEVGIARMMPKK
jgi:DNA-binding transcriptional ArsR family regulator